MINEKHQMLMDRKLSTNWWKLAVATLEMCDFSAIMAVIRAYISQDYIQNQVDFLYMLFGSFMAAKENADFDFDNALVCRWMNGTARVSPRITMM